MNIKPTNKYYFYSFSNFIAALGGGIILGKGVGIIEQPVLQGGSILAFFVGTMLGLVFLQLIPKSMSRVVGRSLSILASLTALMLLYTYNVYSIDEKLVDIPAIVFFALLCVRFGFWFYSRVLRASLAAAQKQKIAWVELGYFFGMILGLVIWAIIGIEVSIATALIMDALLQFSAGIIDLFLSSSVLAPTRSASDRLLVTSKPSVSRYLTSSIVLLTIGIQVVVFSLAHQVGINFTPLILAFYYLGAAASAIMCKKF
jgi:hypothetical protein